MELAIYSAIREAPVEFAICSRNFLVGSPT